MTSLIPVEGVGDDLISINREPTKIVTKLDPSVSKSEGWVYESQRNVGFSPEIMTQNNVSASTDITLVVSDEPNITSPCLIHESINVTKNHPNDSHYRPNFLCCDYEREQDQRKPINCCSFLDFSKSLFSCAAGDQEVLTNTSCFCATNTNNIKKTNSSFCSR